MQVRATVTQGVLPVMPFYFSGRPVDLLGPSTPWLPRLRTASTTLRMTEVCAEQPRSALQIETPSVFRYLPARSAYFSIFRTRFIHHRIGVVDMHKNFPRTPQSCQIV
jgi:hypothetical protein